MAAIIPNTSNEEFGLKDLAGILIKGLPHYAVPKFVRFKDKFETTGTHKIKKTRLRDEGFDPVKVPGPLYVLLPGSEDFVPLTTALYDEIADGAYRF